MCPYVGLTRSSCENIMWPILTELNTKHNIGAVGTVSDLEFTLPNKSKIKLFGADMKNFIDRLRGPKYPIAVIDEAQAFRKHIEVLVDDIFTAATGDYKDGQIVLTGTPGPVPKGYFHDCSKNMNGFKFHNWGVYDNPYFPDPNGFVEKLFVKKKWTKTNPTYRREWLGEWVADIDALVYKFKEQNWVDEISDRDEFYYVIGCDLGYSPDPSAFVVGAFSRFDKNLYLIDAHVQPEMTVGDVADRIKMYLMKFPQAKVIMDLGAQGKMIGAEIRQRYSIPVEAADKAGKAGFIEIFNSELLAGRIKVLKGKMEPLVDEWMNLIWDAEKSQRVEDGRYPNHLADAALYLMRHCYNYAWENRPKPIERGSEREMDAYWEREAERLEAELRAIREAERDELDLRG